MLLPPGFDKDKQYPVLVYLYGGPNSQVVSLKKSTTFVSVHFPSPPPPLPSFQVDESSIVLSLSHIFYVSNLSIILASVDGRGTGYHGDK